MTASNATYYRDSARPLTALVFVLPMLLVYEVGILSLGPSAMRNGAEQWLRQLLDGVGFGQYLLLPILTCVVLLGWHHITRGEWRVSLTTLYRMVNETVFVACALVGVALLQAWLWSALGGQAPASPAAMSVQGTGPNCWFLRCRHLRRTVVSIDVDSPSSCKASNLWGKTRGAAYGAPHWCPVCFSLLPTIKCSSTRVTFFGGTLSLFDSRQE